MSRFRVARNTGWVKTQKAKNWTSGSDAQMIGTEVIEVFGSSWLDLWEAVRLQRGRHMLPNNLNIKTHSDTVVLNQFIRRIAMMAGGEVE